MIPFSHQIAGAHFLAERPRALLADEPRVGKTGATIMALDDVLARRVLVVTTASGRAVWQRAFRDWSAFDVETRALYSAPTPRDLAADRLIVSWDGATRYRAALAGRFDTLILDESHYAKSWDAKRTQAVFGPGGLASGAERVWCLSGTPSPNGPHEMHPMLHALAPERLAARGEWPDVADFEAFFQRYCIWRPKRLSRWNTVRVVLGGKNVAELKARMDGLFLRRTQKDIGILPPIYEILPLHVTAAERREIAEAVPDGVDVLDAAETGETRALEMHLGTLRRVTGAIKARGVAQVVRDDLAGGIDKIVVMAWHMDVLNYLQGALSEFGVSRVDGSTLPEHRERAQAGFAKPGGPRVFLGQIVAAGEAIDLSAAADLIFAESSFVPKDMKQASLRITNVGQTRQPRVRVAALEGSIDEALQTILVRKVATIKELMTA